MNTRNSELRFLALVLGALALAIVCLEEGTQARARLRGLPLPMDRPLPPQLTRLSLMAALGDHARVASDWAYVDCLQYLGNVLNRDDGRYGQTEALYREVLWLDPSFHHAVREGASVLGFNQRRLDAAARYLTDAIHDDPSDSRARLYLVGLAYEKADDPVSMIEVLRPELLRPDAPEMLLRMVGNVYLKEKDWEDAIKYWTWVRGRAKEERTLEMADKAMALAREHLPATGRTR
jgi:tetratricopeptide (TPR) repeat protein